MIKLTATYANEEGRLSKADVARLLDNPSIVELDFVQDVMYEMIALYNQMYAKVFPGAALYEKKLRNGCAPAR